MPFIGVRISWLTDARKLDLAAVAACAVRWASVSASSCRFWSSMSNIRPIERRGSPS